MQDNTKKLHILAVVGLALHIFYTVLCIGIRFYPEPLMALFSSSSEMLDAADIVHHPLMFVMPLVNLAVYFALYYLLRQQLHTRTSFSGALVGLILAAMFVLPISNYIMNTVTIRAISLFYSAAAVAAYSAVNTMIGMVGFVDTLAYPLLLTAAAMNHAREE